MAGIQGMRWCVRNYKKLFKIFVSLPMRDLEISEIKNRQKELFNLITKSGTYENPILLDSIHEHDIPEEDNELWYLGESIKTLGRANLVIFSKDWRSARGCRVEHLICELYKIPHVYEAELDF